MTRHQVKVLISLIVALTVLTGQASASSFNADCRHHVCKFRQTRRIDPILGGTYNAHLKRIHYCEARGVGWFYDGPFDGGLQFSPGTWQKTGSVYRYAYQAPILEQKYRAIVWAQKIGWAWHTSAGWPVCG